MSDSCEKCNHSEPRNIIIYHGADLDGFSSAALVAIYHEANNLLYELVSYNYGYSFDDCLIAPNTNIWAVDISFPPDIMKQIQKECNSFTWIDHHVSAIKSSVTNDYEDINGLRIIGKAGCELVWEYCKKKLNFDFAKNDYLKLSYTPIYLLGRYDVWDHSDQDVMPFQYGMRCADWRPYDKLQIDKWKDLLSNVSEINNIIENGKAILEYVKQTNFITANSKAYQCTFETHNCIALNTPTSNSQVFDSFYDPEKHDYMIVWSYSPKAGNYSASIYSTKEDCDCSIIATKYGGGGHKGASGFTVTDCSIFQQNVRRLDED